MVGNDDHATQATRMITQVKLISGSVLAYSAQLWIDANERIGAC
jgi:hypothetical protein